MVWENGKWKVQPEQRTTEKKKTLCLKKLNIFEETSNKWDLSKSVVSNAMDLAQEAMPILNQVANELFTKTVSAAGVPMPITRWLHELMEIAMTMASDEFWKLLTQQRLRVISKFNSGMQRLISFARQLLQKHTGVTLTLGAAEVSSAIMKKGQRSLQPTVENPKVGNTVIWKNYLKGETGTLQFTSLEDDNKVEIYFMESIYISSNRILADRYLIKINSEKVPSFTTLYKPELQDCRTVGTVDVCKNIYVRRSAKNTRCASAILNNAERSILAQMCPLTTAPNKAFAIRQECKGEDKLMFAIPENTVLRKECPDKTSDVKLEGPYKNHYMKGKDTKCMYYNGRIQMIGPDTTHYTNSPTYPSLQSGQGDDDQYLDLVIGLGSTLMVVVSLVISGMMYFCRNKLKQCFCKKAKDQDRKGGKKDLENATNSGESKTSTLSENVQMVQELEVLKKLWIEMQEKKAVEDEKKSVQDEKKSVEDVYNGKFKGRSAQEVKDNI